MGADLLVERDAALLVDRHERHVGGHRAASGPRQLAALFAIDQLPGMGLELGDLADRHAALAVERHVAAVAELAAKRRRERETTLVVDAAVVDPDEHVA